MAPALTPEQRTRLQRLRFLLVACIASAVVAAGVLIAALALGAAAVWKMVAAFVVVESMVSAAVLGAFARCPACGARLGAASRGLLPPRCAACGVTLEPARHTPRV